MTIDDILNTPELLEVGRLAVENELIALRDARISQLFRGNGLVVREKDGSPSSHIRLGTDDALRIALEAIKTHVEKKT